MSPSSLDLGISILICSYNGSQKIEATLQHIAKQIVSGFPWEIIFVDNGSEDNVLEIAKKSWNSYETDVSFKSYTEIRKGKDKALDLGFSHASYSYVIICDDDNLLSENYLQIAFDTMKADPTIGMLGGMSIPQFEGAFPPWLDQFGSYYAIGKQGETSGELTGSAIYLWGAGCVVNMKAYHYLKTIGFRRILTYENCRSEDVELSLAIKLTGYRLWYNEQLKLYHVISPDRLNWNYLMQLIKTSSKAKPIIRAYWYLIYNPSQTFGNIHRKYLWAYFSQMILPHIDPRILFNAICYFLGIRREGNFLYHSVVSDWEEFFEYFRIRRRLKKYCDSIAMINRNKKTFNQ